MHEQLTGASAGQVGARLLEAIAKSVLRGRNAQRAALVALEALPAPGRAPARARQRARLLRLQGMPAH